MRHDSDDLSINTKGNYIGSTDDAPNGGAGENYANDKSNRVGRVGEIAQIFVETVNNLIMSSAKGKKLYTENLSRGYLNFKVKDYKKSLSLVLLNVEDADIEKHLKIFRTLQWIVCDHDRFTYTQYISGKMVRVITVDSQKYKLLKELIEGRKL